MAIAGSATMGDNPDDFWRPSWKYAYPIYSGEAVAVDVEDRTLWVVRWEAVEFRRLDGGMRELLTGAVAWFHRWDPVWHEAGWFDHDPEAPDYP